MNETMDGWMDGWMNKQTNMATFRVLDRRWDNNSNVTEKLKSVYQL